MLTYSDNTKLHEASDMTMAGNLLLRGRTKVLTYPDKTQLPEASSTTSTSTMLPASNAKVFAYSSDETDLQEAIEDILQEVLKTNSQVYKLSDDLGPYIKIKRPYAQPEARRHLYLNALDVLLTKGVAKLCIKNKELEMYQVKPKNYARKHCLEEAQNHLYQQTIKAGNIYKVHSVNGDFVQCGDITYSEIDHERILYLEALWGLVHRGLVQLVSESRELSTYEVEPSKDYSILNQQLN